MFMLQVKNQVKNQVNFFYLVDSQASLSPSLNYSWLGLGDKRN